jgi:hypothetical protein
MKRRPFVQGTSTRKQVLRRRRIYVSLSETWDALRGRTEKIAREKPAEAEAKPEAA